MARSSSGWKRSATSNIANNLSTRVALDFASCRTEGGGRIIAMSRHPSRQKLAREFGAIDIVTERGDESVARIKELTNDIGADAVL
jgi:threonine dehydrogenase-like Zn-dependent dehydrogenase